MYYLLQITSQAIILKLLSEQELIQDRAGMDRLQAVYTKMDEFLSRYEDTIDEMYSWQLHDKLYSAIISHALRCLTPQIDGSLVGVIQYKPIGGKFEVLSTSEIMKLVDERIDAGQSQGMTKIFLATGYFSVPSFCVSNDNIKAKKLDRRKIKLDEFRQLCAERLLQPDRAELPSSSPNNDGSSCLLLNDLFVKESNYIKTIQQCHPLKRKKLKKDSTNQGSGTRVENAVQTSSNFREPENEKVFEAKEVSKIVVDMYSDNALTKCAPPENNDDSTKSEVPNVSKPSVSGVISSNICKDNISHQANTGVSADKEIDAEALKRKLKNFERNKRRRKRLNNDQNAEFSSTEYNPGHASTSLEVPESNSNPLRFRSFSQQQPDLQLNPARLEKGAHYVCWFDKTDRRFCFRKVRRFIIVKH